jgi:hypothetical protein
MANREVAIEALTGAHAGRALSCEIENPECRRRTRAGRRHSARRYCESHRGTMALLTLDGGDDRPLVFGAHPGATLEN